MVWAGGSRDDERGTGLALSSRTGAAFTLRAPQDRLISTSIKTMEDRWTRKRALHNLPDGHGDAAKIVDQALAANPVGSRQVHRGPRTGRAPTPFLSQNTEPSPQLHRSQRRFPAGRTGLRSLGVSLLLPGHQGISPRSPRSPRVPDM